MQISTGEKLIIPKQKVATNIPDELLEEALRVSGLNQTQAIIAGLKEPIARENRVELLQLKGKIAIGFKPSKSRERRRLK